MATATSEDVSGCEDGGRNSYSASSTVEAGYFLGLCLMRTSSAATSAALATKLLMLLRSYFAASSTCLRSSSVKYTKVFLPRRGFKRRRDADEFVFAIAEMVSPTNVESEGRVT